jgi:hypothetical protein
MRLGQANATSGQVTFAEYRRLADRLATDPRLHPRPLRGLGAPIPEGCVRVALRHDVHDGFDLALRQSRHLARIGLPSTFFLAHTEAFYGSSVEGSLQHDPALPQGVFQLMATGCEIGLKTDPFGSRFPEGPDAALAIETEIAWLRAQRVRVSGTAAEPPLDGCAAEGFEIFAGKAIGDRTTFATASGSARLQLLRQADLGLTYEANFAEVRADVGAETVEEYFSTLAGQRRNTEPVLRLYWATNPVLERGYEATAIPLSQGRWVVARGVGGVALTYLADLAALLGWLDDVPAGWRVVLLVDSRDMSVE